MRPACGTRNPQLVTGRVAVEEFHTYGTNLVIDLYLPQAAYGYTALACGYYSFAALPLIFSLVHERIRDKIYSYKGAVLGMKIIPH